MELRMSWGMWENSVKRESLDEVSASFVCWSKVISFERVMQKVMKYESETRWLRIYWIKEGEVTVRRVEFDEREERTVRQSRRRLSSFEDFMIFSMLVISLAISGCNSEMSQKLELNNSIMFTLLKMKKLQKDKMKNTLLRWEC